MKDKALYILPIAFLLSLAFLAVNAEAVVTACGMNVSVFNLSPAGVSISGATVTVNWTVVFGSNSDTMNVTNVTIFKNNTRQILCQNLSLRINTTNTKGNCTFDSTSFVDDDAFSMVGEAYFANATAGNPGRCTNISFTAGMNLNNTVPTLNGTASTGTTFYSTIDPTVLDLNLSVAVDNATRNCTLLIKSGDAIMVRSVRTKGPTGSPQNCTYNVARQDVGSGSYNIIWSAFDGLDTRNVTSNYNFLFGNNKNPGTPQIEIGQVVAEQKQKSSLMTVTLFILLLGAAVYVVSNKHTK